MNTLAMIWTSLVEDYFEWLIEFAYDKDTFPVSYSKLFRKMFETKFKYSVIDTNRALDGVYLRYRFADTEYINEAQAEKEFDIFPCSVLEALMALALRCEEDIMGNDTYGDRTGQWFWEMIQNMGLSVYNDSNYDEEEVTDILRRFNERDYADDGKGYAFRSFDIETAKNTELWYQMQQHLIDIGG